MSIEGIELEHFTTLSNSGINSLTKSCLLHSVFQYLFSDYSKQDAATTNSHIIFFIGLLKERKILASALITIWEASDGCVDKYRCASTLYLMSVMLKYY